MPPTLDALLAARTVWHAGRTATADVACESTGHDALDTLLPQGGWPPRALTELLLPADGIGELSLLLPTLARLTQAGETVALVAPPYVPYAPAWQSAGVELAQLQVVDAAPRDALWAFEQCLRSGACAAVLGWPVTGDAQALRRLQVAADSGQCLAFALRDRRHAANPSPAALRIEAVCARGGVEWNVRKCRGGNAPAHAFVVTAVMPAAESQPDTHGVDRTARQDGGAGAAVRNNALHEIRIDPDVAMDVSGKAAVAAVMAANASGCDASSSKTSSERIRAQSPPCMKRTAPHQGNFSEMVRVADASGSDADAREKSIRGYSRSHRPQLETGHAIPVGTALAANASGWNTCGTQTGDQSICAQARSHMPWLEPHKAPPRFWPRRTHPHAPRTLFD